MNDADMDQRIVEIERALVEDDPAMADRFARLDVVAGRAIPAREPHRAVVRALATIGFVFLLVGIAAASPVVSLLAVAAIASACLVAERDERRYLRAVAVEAGREHRPSGSRS